MLTKHHRAFYAALVTAKGDSTSTAIRSAFDAVDRRRFLGAGPWKIATARGYIETPNADESFIYQDVAVALASSRSINSGEPSFHARCLAAVSPQPNDRVLHIGTGTGYYTAILAELVGPGGLVNGYEVDPVFAEKATQNLASYRCVRLQARSGVASELPAADIIYVNAGSTRPRSEWISALTQNGRLIFPLLGVGWKGAMLMITREGERRYTARIITSTMFVPCLDAFDDDEAVAVSDALKSGQLEDVRSFRWGTQPDASVWLRGKDWWISKNAPAG